MVAVARREPLLQKLIAECQPQTPRLRRTSSAISASAPLPSASSTTPSTRYGRLDVLVNNAAISKHKQIYHTSADEADYVMRVNFMSCVWTTFAAIPHMLRQGGGTIVNISSFAAKVVAAARSRCTRPRRRR